LSARLSTTCAHPFGMAREHIPDAREGSAPGLEIRHRIGRLVASEGSQPVHSVALTTLSNKHLEGIPIAQKIAEKKFRYLDSSGKEVTKQKAMGMADGVVYYQEVVDPSKGRLRYRGTFVSEDDARTIVSGSRGGSDVANIRDFGWDDENLHSIKEETEEAQQNIAEEAQKSKKTVNAGLLLRLFALVLFMAVSTLSWPVARHELILSNSGHHAAGSVHIGRPEEVNHADSGSPLSPEIASLLEADEMVAKAGNEILTRALLGMPRPAEDDNTSVEERKRQAAAEIDRILASRKVSDILGAGPLSRQQQEFQRIVLLIHPDKGFVSGDDRRAFDALRLTFAARRRHLPRPSR